MIIAHDIGDDFPLPVRQPDDLRRHDDRIGALSEIDHADIFAAVVQKRCDPKQQPFPSAHAMHALHAVKNRQCDLLQRLRTALAAI